MVQQLTRYYAAIADARPFEEQVDYSKPVALVAIAPCFHRDNWTDRQYSTLDLQFLQFQIVERRDQLYLQLKAITLERSDTVYSPIKIVHTVQSLELPKPPTAFLRILSQSKPREREAIEAIRSTILTFDTRMEEHVCADVVRYGRGKKHCAEIRYDSLRQRPTLILWLPYALGWGSSRRFVARVRLWTNSDWSIVLNLGYVRQGMGKKLSYEEWKEGKLRPIAKMLPKELALRERFFTDVRFRNSFIQERHPYCISARSEAGLALPFDSYKKLIQQPQLIGRVDELLQLALKTWLGKLTR